MNEKPTSVIMHNIDETGEGIIRWPIPLNDETKQIVADATN